MLVQQFDLRQRLIGNFLLLSQFIVEQRHFAARVGAGGQRGLLRIGFGKVALKAQNKNLHVRAVLLGQRKLAHQFSNLIAQVLQRAVFVRHQLRQDKLGQHENRQQKNQHEQQARHGIDKAGPIIGARGAAAYASGIGHQLVPTCRDA